MVLVHGESEYDLQYAIYDIYRYICLLSVMMMVLVSL